MASHTAHAGPGAHLLSGLPHGDAWWDTVRTCNVEDEDEPVLAGVLVEGVVPVRIVKDDNVLGAMVGDMGIHN